MVHEFPSSNTGGVPGVQAPLALQASLPLQTLPSAQDVPVETGVCVTPLTESQASVVHGLPSSVVSGVPGIQEPDPLHVSAPLQILASAQDVPASTALCVTPLTESQLSEVQGLPSSNVGGVPRTQVPPALQVSLPLQALPSEQGVPTATGLCATPVTGSQLSAVQGFWSSIVNGVPGIQDPDALQVSLPLQTLLSAQDVPAATGVCVTPVPGLQLSAVQGFPSSRMGAVPGLHEPLELHVSLPLHALPSVQDVPEASG